MHEHHAEYWKRYAQQLVGSIESNIELKELTRNTALTGAYAESTVRALAQKIILPYSVSTGSVISQHLYKQHRELLDEGKKVAARGVLKQVDMMAWTATPTPPVFESNGFALVPYQSFLGGLEIKRTCYNSKIGQQMVSTLNWLEGLAAEIPKPAEGFPFVIEMVPDPNWIGLGVICVRTLDCKIDSVLGRLIDDGRAVVLLEEQADGSLSTNVSHVLHLVQFLVNCKVRANNRLGTEGVSSENIGKYFGERRIGSLHKENPKVLGQATVVRRPKPD